MNKHRLSLGMTRPSGWSFGASALLHAGVIGALVAWLPVRHAPLTPTYEVELVTAPRVVMLTTRPRIVAPNKAEPPPKPPEIKKEIPPPDPQSLRVAEKPRPAPVTLPRVAVLVPGIPAPLRIAVAGVPAPAAVVRTNAVGVAGDQGTTDVADPAYVNSVRSAVARQLRYPEQALRRGIEGRVVLRLKLDGSGKLLAAAAGEPAGEDALLGAALAAVRRAAPFPPWHNGRSSNVILNLELPIRFKLEIQ